MATTLLEGVKLEIIWDCKNTHKTIYAIEVVENSYQLTLLLRRIFLLGRISYLVQQVMERTVLRV